MNKDFVAPFKKASLIERSFSPALDIMMKSPLMRNSYVFMYNDMTVCYWPELCIITVDRGSYHYWGFITKVDLDKGDYEMEWYLRSYFHPVMLNSVPFDTRVVDYAIGYCNVKSYTYELKTE